MKTKFERGYSKQGNVEIDVDIKNETEHAILASDGDITAWIPKSQLIDFDWDDDYITGKSMTITIPEWLAKDKGLI